MIDKSNIVLCSHGAASPSANLASLQLIAGIGASSSGFHRQG